MPPSPTRSSTRPRRSTANGDLPSFMRRPPKPEGVKTILANASLHALTAAELEDRYQHNARILAETSASSSHFIKQLEDQQAAIRSRLNDLGVEGIRSQLEHTKIEEEESMSVDPPPPPPDEYRPIGAKARALARWNPTGTRGAAAGGMSYDEATNILRETYQREQEHKARVIDRRRRRGEVMPGEKLTRAEMDARMLAFLTYKPTDSDLEDDDDDDEGEEEDDGEGRPSWFDEDDQDDGIKGQDIIEPDYEDLSSVIRIDEARIPWSIPREE
ncbi:hypothetical protein GSI_00964 [Ganoderma sinense ZZ0214-1]|uniref:Uncharacterized protein n=1 Tax=Ganoderma sinense ZZ0214-1 TaxID=1077348 RepID=A0A2G8SU15_9APHY|nr:hypothetical protein GSI_00964 [Ganoderma sinense ZZ0214-1]